MDARHNQILSRASSLYSAGAVLGGYLRYIPLAAFAVLYHRSVHQEIVFSNKCPRLCKKRHHQQVLQGRTTTAGTLINTVCSHTELTEIWVAKNNAAS